MRSINSDDQGVQDKLSKMERRIEKMRVAFAAERILSKRRKEEARAKIAAIVGEVLLAHAESVPDFGIMLRQVLAATDLKPAERKILGRDGWL